MSYVNLHTHSEYSNLKVIDSINKLDVLIKTAKDIGLRGMALTDHDTLSGHVKALNFYKSMCEKDESWKDFKLILGNEIYLTENGRNKETAAKGQRYPHFILLALDSIGHEQIREISSRAWNRSFTMFLTRVPTWYSDLEEVIGSNPGHVVATSACIGGQLGINFQSTKDSELAESFISWCKGIFLEENFFLEMAPSSYEDQIAYNKWLMELSIKTNTPLTIATDAHYTRPEKRQIHEAFLKSKEEERETKDFYMYTYLMTEEEIKELMPYLNEEIINEALANTNKIADRASEYSLFDKQKIPHLEDDRGSIEWNQVIDRIRIREKFKYLNNYLSSDEEDDRYLIYLALTKLNSMKISKDKKEQILDRLEQELEECWEISKKIEQPISSYLLTVRNVIGLIWNEANSLVGVARGSAGGFILNYLIDITQMNPLEQGTNLPHWRFIHKDRPELPDIDVDSEGSKRPLIVEAIKNAAGRVGGQAVSVCTFGTEGTRSAILTAARGLGIDIDIAQYLAGMIPQERGFLWSLSDCVYGNEEKGRKKIRSLIDEFNKNDNLLETALEIEGLVCRTGIHACFDGETKVPTNNGVKNIKDIRIGDSVLTIDGTYQKVTKTMINDSEHLYEIKSKGIIEPIKATANHPFLVLRDSQELWVNVEDLKIDDRIGTPINNKEIPLKWELDIPMSNELIWFFGRFVGDGWLEERCRKGKYLDCDKDILLCCNKNNNEKEVIIDFLERAGLKYRISEYRTSYKFVIHNLSLLKWMRIFGKGAYNKTIPACILDLPKEQLTWFLNGYLSADGHKDKWGTYSYKTISPSLAFGLNVIYHKLNLNYVTNGIQYTLGKEIIENRTVSAHNRYYGILSQKKKDWNSIIHNNKIWYKIDSIEEIDNNDFVYNLEVENNHTYLANGAIVHNCGIVIFNDPIYKRNALMKAPNGTDITQYDLGDTEFMGGIKFDLLSVEGLDKIHATLDLLLEDKKIEWQGTLKKTYDKYLHPDILDRESIDMWKLLWDNKLIDAFQMDSSVGKQTLSLTKPSNIPELTAANSLMRLMPEGAKETPPETFAKFKEDITLWYKEMLDAGLNEEEIGILKKEIGYTYGVANTQEEIMLLAMNPAIANFSVKEANKLRKAVAKKKASVLAEVKTMFYEKGLANNTSQAMLDYTWNIQIMKQAGYGFSIIHATAYSLIGLQEMNLAYKFPSVYWTTACLSINSGAADIDDDNNKNTNYGKLSSAIGRIQNNGVIVELPNINIAKFGFTPDVEQNSIMFGLKGISEINDTLIKKIIENRPYTGVEDFIVKCNPQSKQIINLIKSGCFDDLAKKDRREILYDYIKSVTPGKTRITLQNMPSLIRYGLIPDEYSFFIKLFNFNKYLKNSETPSGYGVDDRAYDYLESNFDLSNISTMNNKMFMSKHAWDNIYKKNIDGIRVWMQSEQDNLISQIQEKEIGLVWDKYCEGNISCWEMDTLGFYYSGHELNDVNPTPFEITRITDLPDSPEILYKQKISKDKEIPVYKISTIMGTVLDKTSYKHTITLLTLDGVITVKCVNEQFGKYDKTISRISEETGKKETVENSWFKKGNKIIINGWKNGDMFMARGRKVANIYPFHKITEIDDLGNITTTRFRFDD